MIGKQIQKPVADWSYYTETPICCDTNKTMTEDKGDYDEVIALPERTLKEAKEAKLTELNASFESMTKTAHCLSTAGFEIDADESLTQHRRTGTCLAT